MSKPRLVLVLSFCAFWLALPLARAQGRHAQMELAILFLLCAGLPLLWISTEAERPRLARPLQLPRRLPRPLRRALPVLFLPGGGRGLLLTWLLLGGTLGVSLSIELAVTGRAFGDDDPVQLAMICMYACCYVGLPSAAAAPFSSAKGARIAARAAAFALLIGGQWISVLADIRRNARANWPDLTFAGPFDLLETVRGSGVVSPEYAFQFTILSTLAAASVLVNLPRVLRSVCRALAASSAGS